MMAQSIPIQALGMGITIRGPANAAKGSVRNGFELFLNGSIERDTKVIDAKTNTNDTQTKSINNTDTSLSTNKNNSIMQADSNGSDIQTNKVMSNDEQKADDLDYNSLAEGILIMLNQIREVIIEALDLTPEELDVMMKDMGLELSDLADPQVIMQLVLANNGQTDPFVMLVDEQLGDTFQSLIAAVNEIKDQTNLKLTDDEFKLILEQSTVIKDSDAADGGGEIKMQQYAAGSEQPKDTKEDDEDGSKVIRFQKVSEDSGTSEQRTVVTSKSDQGLKDTNDGESKSDKSGESGFEVFLDRLDAHYDKPIIKFTDDNVRLYDIREIAQQIIEQIRVVINPEQTSMELQLYPEHLGKVNLTVSSRDGVMTAHFTVQNEIAKEAVEGQLIMLKDTLAQQGIKVESIEVTVASYTFDQESHSDDANQHMNKKQRSGHRITFEEAVTMSEEPLEKADAILAGTAGYTIDYTA